MTPYHLRAYATNNQGTAYGTEVIFITTSSGTHYIGETYGGGIVFYTDGTGQHGLISSTSDQSSGAEWGCSGTSIPGTSTAIWTGYSNTTAIINGCSTSGIAARLCRNYTGGGYNDWYLPSLEELHQLYLKRSVVGIPGYSTGFWSSSEYSSDQAYGYSWQDYPFTSLKYLTTYRVRAVRSF
jgi:hypothetical protein